MEKLEIPTYIQRMRDEGDQLADRLRKLNSFLNSDQFEQLDPADRALLKAQRCMMDGYLEVLRTRVAHALGLHI
jgi:hypothetical protein